MKWPFAITPENLFLLPDFEQNILPIPVIVRVNQQQPVVVEQY